MNILTTRFGVIQACESDVILIPEGLLGFRSFTHYIHLPDPVVHGLTWLQSLTAPNSPSGWLRLRLQSATTESKSAQETEPRWSWRTNVPH